MRWEELFADLEAQLAAAHSLELAAEVADRTRSETAQLRLVDRLVPAIGGSVRLRVWGAGDLAGQLRQVGIETLLVAEARGRHMLIPVGAVLSVTGIPALSAVPGGRGQVFERLRLSSALRALARDRACLRVFLRDGAILTGTLDRVGADFAELAEHAPGEPRRAGSVDAVRTIPHSALGALVSC